MRMLRIEGLDAFRFFLNVDCSYFSTYLRDIGRVVQTRDGDRGNPFPLFSRFKEGLATRLVDAQCAEHVRIMYVCMYVCMYFY